MKTLLRRPDGWWRRVGMREPQIFYLYVNITDQAGRTSGSFRGGGGPAAAAVWCILYGSTQISCLLFVYLCLRSAKHTIMVGQILGPGFIREAAGILFISLINFQSVAMRALPSMINCGLIVCTPIWGATSNKHQIAGKLRKVDWFYG